MIVKMVAGLNDHGTKDTSILQQHAPAAVVPSRTSMSHPCKMGVCPRSMDCHRWVSSAHLVLKVTSSDDGDETTNNAHRLAWCGAVMPFPEVCHFGTSFATNSLPYVVRHFIPA